MEPRVEAGDRGGAGPAETRVPARESNPREQSLKTCKVLEKAGAPVIWQPGDLKDNEMYMSLDFIFENGDYPWFPKYSRRPKVRGLNKDGSTHKVDQLFFRFGWFLIDFYISWGDN